MAQGKKESLKLYNELFETRVAVKKNLGEAKEKLVKSVYENFLKEGIKCYIPPKRQDCIVVDKKFVFTFTIDNIIRITDFNNKNEVLGSKVISKFQKEKDLIKYIKDIYLNNK